MDELNRIKSEMMQVETNALVDELCHYHATETYKKNYKKSGVDFKSIEWAIWSEGYEMGYQMGLKIMSNITKLTKELQ